MKQIILFLFYQWRQLELKGVGDSFKVIDPEKQQNPDTVMESEFPTVVLHHLLHSLLSPFSDTFSIHALMFASHSNNSIIAEKKIFFSY